MNMIIRPQVTDSKAVQVLEMAETYWEHESASDKPMSAPEFAHERAIFMSVVEACVKKGDALDSDSAAVLAYIADKALERMPDHHKLYILLATVEQEVKYDDAPDYQDPQTALSLRFIDADMLKRAQILDLVCCYDSSRAPIQVSEAFAAQVQKGHVDDVTIFGELQFDDHGLATTELTKDNLAITEFGEFVLHRVQAQRAAAQPHMAADDNGTARVRGGLMVIDGGMP